MTSSSGMAAAVDLDREDLVVAVETVLVVPQVVTAVAPVKAEIEQSGLAGPSSSMC